MVAWLIFGSISLAVVIAAVVVVFRVLVMAADAELDDDAEDLEDSRRALDSDWSRSLAHSN